MNTRAATLRTVITGTRSTGPGCSVTAVAAARAILAAALLLSACAASRSVEADRLARILKLRSGMAIADVGAGDGAYTVELARHVGDTGQVFATEVDEEELDRIRDKVRSRKLSNVTLLLGDQEATGLEEGCCDAILLRLVYHHFTQPELMRADLRRALKGDGLLAIVDITPQEDWRELPGVPDRGGHGIGPAGLIAELTGDGFEFVERIDDWTGDEDRYCVVFRRAETGEPVR